MATEVVKTIRSSGGDYTTLSGWEAGEQADLVTADEIAVAECYNDWPSGLSDKVYIDGWTVDATRYVIVRTPASERHDGTPGSGFFMTDSTTWNRTFRTNTNYTRVIGLEARHPGASGSGFYATIGSWTVQFEGCIAYDCYGGTKEAGFYMRRETAINCLAIDCSGDGFACDVTWYAFEAYACTAINCGNGFNANGGGTSYNDSTHLKNCVAYDCTTSYASGAYNSDCTNNAADDASTNTPPGSNPITTDIVSGDFTDAANDDYSLASGSTLIDAGADLSSDFTDDILGNARGATWDVGAFEYIAGGGGTDALTADDVESSSETTSPAVGQEHGLNASDTQSTSETTSPAIGQVHALLADDDQSTSEVTAPAIQQVVPLSANDTESASETTSPAIGQVHVLAANDDESASEVESPALGQIHALTSSSTESASEVSSPALAEVNNVHVLYANDTESTSELTTPGLGQIHALAANDIQGLSQVTTPSLGIVGAQQPGNYTLMRRRGRR